MFNQRFNFIAFVSGIIAPAPLLSGVKLARAQHEVGPGANAHQAHQMQLPRAASIAVFSKPSGLFGPFGHDLEQELIAESKKA
jgi:hypothetical protein